jgi:hypothetical protein
MITSYVLWFIILIYESVCVSGHEVVIVKNGQRLCGSGGALASAPLVQSKAYFEVKIQQSGN